MPKHEPPTIKQEHIDEIWQLIQQFSDILKPGKTFNPLRHNRIWVKVYEVALSRKRPWTERPTNTGELCYRNLWRVITTNRKKELEAAEGAEGDEQKPTRPNLRARSEAPVPAENPDDDHTEPSPPPKKRGRPFSRVGTAMSPPRSLRSRSQVRGEQNDSETERSAASVAPGEKAHDEYRETSPLEEKPRRHNLRARSVAPIGNVNTDDNELEQQLVDHPRRSGLRARSVAPVGNVNVDDNELEKELVEHPRRSSLRARSVAPAENANDDDIKAGPTPKKRGRPFSRVGTAMSPPKSRRSRSHVRGEQKDSETAADGENHAGPKVPPTILQVWPDGAKPANISPPPVRRQPKFGPEGPIDTSLMKKLGLPTRENVLADVERENELQLAAEQSVEQSVVQETTGADTILTEAQSDSNMEVEQEDDQTAAEEAVDILVHAPTPEDSTSSTPIMVLSTNNGHDCSTDPAFDSSLDETRSGQFDSFATENGPDGQNNCQQDISDDVPVIEWSLDDPLPEDEEPLVLQTLNQKSTESKNSTKKSKLPGYRRNFEKTLSSSVAPRKPRGKKVKSFGTDDDEDTPMDFDFDYNPKNAKIAPVKTPVKKSARGHIKKMIFSPSLNPSRAGSKENDKSASQASNYMYMDDDGFESFEVTAAMEQADTSVPSKESSPVSGSTSAEHSELVRLLNKSRSPQSDDVTNKEIRNIPSVKPKRKYVRNNVRGKGMMNRKNDVFALAEEQLTGTEVQPSEDVSTLPITSQPQSSAVPKRKYVKRSACWQNVMKRNRKTAAPTNPTTQQDDSVDTSNLVEEELSSTEIQPKYSAEDSSPMAFQLNSSHVVPVRKYVRSSPYWRTGMKKTDVTMDIDEPIEEMFQSSTQVQLTPSKEVPASPMDAPLQTSSAVRKPYWRKGMKRPRKSTATTQNNITMNTTEPAEKQFSDVVTTSSVLESSTEEKKSHSVEVIRSSSDVLPTSAVEASSTEVRPTSSASVIRSSSETAVIQLVQPADTVSSSSPVVADSPRIIIKRRARNPSTTVQEPLASTETPNSRAVEPPVDDQPVVIKRKFIRVVSYPAPNNDAASNSSILPTSSSEASSSSVVVQPPVKRIYIRHSKKLLNTPDDVTGIPSKPEEELSSSKKDRSTSAAEHVSTAQLEVFPAVVPSTAETSSPAVAQSQTTPPVFPRTYTKKRPFLNRQILQQKGLELQPSTAESPELDQHEISPKKPRMSSSPPIHHKSDSVVMAQDPISPPVVHDTLSSMVVDDAPWSNKVTSSLSAELDDKHSSAFEKTVSPPRVDQTVLIKPLSPVLFTTLFTTSLANQFSTEEVKSQDSSALVENSMDLLIESEEKELTSTLLKTPAVTEDPPGASPLKISSSSPDVLQKPVSSTAQQMEASPKIVDESLPSTEVKKQSAAPKAPTVDEPLPTAEVPEEVAHPASDLIGKQFPPTKIQETLEAEADVVKSSSTLDDNITPAVAQNVMEAAALKALAVDDEIPKKEDNQSEEGAAPEAPAAVSEISKNDENQSEETAASKTPAIVADIKKNVKNQNEETAAAKASAIVADIKKNDENQSEETAAPKSLAINKETSNIDEREEKEMKLRERACQILLTEAMAAYLQMLANNPGITPVQFADFMSKPKDI